MSLHISIHIGKWMRILKIIKPKIAMKSSIKVMKEAVHIVKRLDT